jgi:hypothetical protein
MILKRMRSLEKIVDDAWVGSSAGFFVAYSFALSRDKPMVLLVRLSNRGMIKEGVLNEA